MQNLIEIILDLSKDKKPTSTVGVSILQSVEGYLSRIKTTAKQELEDRGIDLDNLFSSEDLLRLEELKNCEKEGDLAWCSRQSWNCLTDDAKTFLEEILKPLNTTYYYFRYSILVANIEELLKLCGNGYFLTILSDLGYYEIVIENGNSRSRNMKDKDLFNRRDVDTTRTIVSVGYKNNKIVVKYGNKKDISTERLT